MGCEILIIWNCESHEVELVLLVKTFMWSYFFFFIYLKYREICRERVELPSSAYSPDASTAGLGQGQGRSCNSIWVSYRVIEPSHWLPEYTHSGKLEWEVKLRFDLGCGYKGLNAFPETFVFLVDTELFLIEKNSLTCAHHPWAFVFFLFLFFCISV